MKPQVNEKLRLAGCVYARPTAAIRLRPGSDQEGLVPAAATAGLARCTRRCCYATLSEGQTVTAPGVEASGDTMQITSPDETAALIDRLRTAGITLTYDPDTRTIRTGDSVIAAVTVGRDR